jgi:Rab3 GTPase-activating protein catalytic subunit
MTEHAVLAETVEYNHKKYFLRYHFNGPASLMDLMDSASDFSSLAHPLAHWFGFGSFMTVEGESITELEECRLLLSGLVIAFDTIHHPSVVVPVFVPYGRARPRDYLGYMMGRDANVQLSSKATYVKVTPSLSWLVKDLCRRGRATDQSNISIAVHCTWKSNMNPHGGWLDPVSTPPGSYHQESPWGPDLDPITLVAFSTTCHVMLEDGVPLDGIGEDPSKCPHWSLLCHLDPVAEAPMTDSVRMLLQAMDAGEEFKTVKEAASDQRIGRVLLEPLLLPSRDEVNRMISELFSETHPATRFFDRKENTEFLLDVKSAPPLTLLSSLCMYLLNLEGLPGVAFIWQEFVKELRFHWDHFSELPRTGVPNGEPHSFCKTFQRLQMLNWCILQRKERNETAKKAALGGWGDADFDSVSSSGEEEEEEGDEEGKGKEKPQGEGLKSKVGINLLVSDLPMYAPFTQDQCVATTEDILDEQQALLLSLESSEARAKLQSRSLLSDMEAFRAANPGCLLEDFVRWHSAKDWVVESVSKKRAKNVERGKQEDGSYVYKEEGKTLQGRLSSRMGEEGNLWDQLWQEAKAIPASRQKPLIDHVREGERILSMFEQMEPFQLLQEVVLVNLTSIWHTFQAYPSAQVPVVKRQISAFATTLIEVGGTRGYVGEFGPEDLEPCVAELEKLENLSSCATSLLCKLGSNVDLVNALLKDGRGNNNVNLESDADKELAMHYMTHAFDDLEEGGFLDESHPLPPPNEREYLLRRQSVLPDCNRMYARVGDDGLVRLATAECQRK